MVHCKAAGCAPVAVMVNGRLTVAPGEDKPGDKAKDRFWLNAVAENAAPNSRTRLK
jgi:hypothetical protein